MMWVRDLRMFVVRQKDPRIQLLMDMSSSRRISKNLSEDGQSLQCGGLFDRRGCLDD